MGDSRAREDDPFTIETLARDLLSLIQHLQWSEVALCGHSMGGRFKKGDSYHSSHLTCIIRHCCSESFIPTLSSHEPDSLTFSCDTRCTRLYIIQTQPRAIRTQVTKETERTLDT